MTNPLEGWEQQPSGSHQKVIRGLTCAWHTHAYKRYTFQWFILRPHAGDQGNALACGFSSTWEEAAELMHTLAPVLTQHLDGRESLRWKRLTPDAGFTVGKIYPVRKGNAEYYAALAVFVVTDDLGREWSTVYQSDHWEIMP